LWCSDTDRPRVGGEGDDQFEVKAIRVGRGRRWKTDVKTLFGLHPTSQNVEEYISSLSSLANTGNDDKAQIKAYPDAVFVNYYALGCSIEYRPTNGYKPSSNIQSIADLQTNNLALDKIDIYNSPTTTSPASTGTTEDEIKDRTRVRQVPQSPPRDYLFT
jgi:hypothetical protein